MIDQTPLPLRPDRWQLGDWLVEPARNVLRDADGNERTLEPRVMAVLELLLAKAASGAEPVSDDTLLAQVWPGVAVSDASVYQAIAQLRKALGDSGKPYRYVGRVSGKGYYLMQPAQALAGSTGSFSGDFSNNVNNTTSSISTATPSQPPASPVLDKRTDTAAIAPALPRSKRYWPLLAAILALTGALGWLVLTHAPTPANPPANQPTAITATTTAPNPTGANPETVVIANNGMNNSGMSNSDAHADSPGWDDYLQGRWLWNQRKPEQLNEAASYFRAALAKDPNLALASVGLCDVFHFQHLYGDWPLSKVLAQCEPLLRDALQREPELGAALASFGLLKLTQGELDAAATFLERALTREPDNAMAWLWSGQILQRRGDVAGATERMRRAAELDPLSAIVKRSQSHLLMNTGDFIGAQQAFEEALLLEPDYADRALDEIEMRPLTVARAVAFIQWAKRFPDRSAANQAERGVGVQTNLAMVYLALRDLPQADAALQQAEAVAPQHPYVQLTRAVWWRAKGNPKQALAVLQRRAEQSAQNPFYRQVAMLQQAEVDGQDVARARFEQAFPDYQTAITPPLQLSQLRTLISWLWLAPTSKRHQLQPAMQTFLATSALPFRMKLQLRLLVGEQQAVGREWLALLQNGELPSPADEYFLPEDHPLWRGMDPEIFRQLQQNRAQALQQLRQ
ncbi:tetratricopeptide repeat protein [Permianibacter sp. IMCC34836]|uniref:tetratricopeptide repeat protein n=1 Tax=Permianibacter fluminis TaxID=2738515 RepID=UPI001555099F|nr:tetratricopeptide repeat protein [Permianibacter fluminis]NQD35891.1 tetratricopeptide repeat protein [Permianibacter fluminis]